MKKKIIVFFLAVVLCLTLCSCSKLKGTYTSENGRFTVVFDTDGTCKWYQDSMYFYGTYEATDDGWTLYVDGSGVYVNTVFTAVKDGKNLIIDGGIVNHKTFIKQ